MGCKVLQKYFKSILKGEILVTGKIINNIHTIYHRGKAGSRNQSIMCVPGLADNLGVYNIPSG